MVPLNFSVLLIEKLKIKIKIKTPANFRFFGAICLMQLLEFLQFFIPFVFYDKIPLLYSDENPKC